jgi:hypothetical protein
MDVDRLRLVHVVPSIKATDFYSISLGCRGGHRSERIGSCYLSFNTSDGICHDSCVGLLIGSDNCRLLEAQVFSG